MNELQTYESLDEATQAKINNFGLMEHDVRNADGSYSIRKITTFDQLNTAYESVGIAVRSIEGSKAELVMKIVGKIFSDNIYQIMGGGSQYPTIIVK
jgi:transketolase N-terminal domain/subunit